MLKLCKGYPVVFPASYIHFMSKDVLKKEMVDRFKLFIEDNNLDRMNRNLRKIFIDYLRQQSAGLDVNFDEILYDMEAIFNLLDDVSDIKRS